MLYAVIRIKDNKIMKIWHKLNHFTSSGWANADNGEYKIAALETKVVAEYPINADGIAQIRSFNNTLPKGNNKKPGKSTHRHEPENLIPGII